MQRAVGSERGRGRERGECGRGRLRPISEWMRQRGCGSASCKEEPAAPGPQRGRSQDRKQGLPGQTVARPPQGVVPGWNAPTSMRCHQRPLASARSQPCPPCAGQRVQRQKGTRSSPEALRLNHTRNQKPRFL